MIFWYILTILLGLALTFDYTICLFTGSMPILRILTDSFDFSVPLWVLTVSISWILALLIKWTVF